MNEETKPPTSLSPPDGWAERRIQLMDNIERDLTGVRMALHHKDDELVAALRVYRAKIDDVIHEVMARVTIIDHPATESPESSENLAQRLPLPPGMPRSKPETEAPISIGPILDLTAALRAEKEGTPKP